MTLACSLSLAHRFCHSCRQMFTVVVNQIKNNSPVDFCQAGPFPHKLWIAHRTNNRINWNTFKEFKGLSHSKWLVLLKGRVRCGLNCDWFRMLWLLPLTLTPWRGQIHELLLYKTCVFYFLFWLQILLKTIQRPSKSFDNKRQLSHKNGRGN